VFDFTVRILTPNQIKIVDDEDVTIQKITLSPETIQKIPSIKESKDIPPDLA
jgi:hypothetical protein